MSLGIAKWLDSVAIRTLKLVSASIQQPICSTNTTSGWCLVLWTLLGLVWRPMRLHVNAQIASRNGECFLWKLSVNNASATGEMLVKGDGLVHRTPEAFTHFWQWRAGG